MNLNAAPNGHQTSSFISIFLSIITRKTIWQRGELNLFLHITYIRVYNFEKSASKAMFQNLQRGGGGGGGGRNKGLYRSKISL